MVKIGTVRDDVVTGLASVVEFSGAEAYVDSDVVVMNVVRTLDVLPSPPVEVRVSVQVVSMGERGEEVSGEERSLVVFREAVV